MSTRIGSGMGIIGNSSNGNNLAAINFVVKLI